jgi:myo-inositol-1(or 4)-monophosphatase
MTQEICAQTCVIIQEVGAFIQKQAENFNAAEAVSDKSHQNLVSYVDKTAEQMLVTGLLALLPDAQILAEEGTVAPPSDSPYCWIIDPLDGTTNFVHGLPFFSISVALTHNSELVLGVVYEVMRGELFYAWQGSPAFLNGKIISVSQTKTLADSLLATGFPYYQFEQADQYLRIFEAFMRQARGIRRLGSAALDLAYVACGRFDAYFEYNLKSWDVAAGCFIVQQAGGTVADFHNKNKDWLSGVSVVATNGALHEAVFTEINKHWKAQ